MLLIWFYDLQGVKAKRKLLVPRGDRSIEAIPGNMSSSTGSAAKPVGVAAREKRSATAHRRAVSPSSSSDSVEIGGKVQAFVTASPGGYSGPKIHSHKSPFLVDEDERHEDRSSCPPSRIRKPIGRPSST